MAQRPRGGFRYNELNLAGWAAVLLPGAVGGLAVARLWGVPVGLAAVVGVGVSWTLALAVDRWQGSRLPVTIEVSDLTLDAVDRLVAELRQDGVELTVRQWNPPPEPDGPSPPARSALRTTGRYRRQVLAAADAERHRRPDGP